MPLILRSILLFGLLLLVNGPSALAQEGGFRSVDPARENRPSAVPPQVYGSRYGTIGANPGTTSGINSGVNMNNGGHHLNTDVRVATRGFVEPCSPSSLASPSRRRDFTLIVESQPPMSAIPQGGRQSFFQGVNAEVTWLPAFGGDGLGMTRVRLGATAALPLPTKNRPLLISPSFAVDFLSFKEKDRFDASRTLYGTGLNLLWLTPLGSKTLFTLGASPSWSSDFKQDSGEALRVPVNFGLTWLCNPRTRIMIGAAYLDRSDYPWIPLVGLTWTPTPDWQIELGVPRTRISRRIACGPDPGDPNGAQRAGSDWVYLGGDFGGGTWAVERGDGVNDILLYADYRILIGFERRRPGGFTWGFEIGCAFSREMEYDSGYGKFNPEDTFFLRLRTSF